MQFITPKYARRDDSASDVIDMSLVRIIAFPVYRPLQITKEIHFNFRRPCIVHRDDVLPGKVKSYPFWPHTPHRHVRVNIIIGPIYTGSI